MSAMEIPASPIASATSGAMSSIATRCSFLDLVYICAPGPRELGKARHSRLCSARVVKPMTSMPVPLGARSTITAAPASPSVSDASCLLNKERIWRAAFQPRCEMYSPDTTMPQLISPRAMKS
jgi:hypothetical protein